MPDVSARKKGEETRRLTKNKSDETAAGFSQELFRFSNWNVGEHQQPSKATTARLSPKSISSSEHKKGKYE